MSFISNVQECYKGDKTISEAAVDVVIDTEISAIKGIGIGIATAYTKQTLIKVGVKNLTKGSAPAAIVTSTIEAGINIYSDVPKLICGDIGKGEFAIRAAGHTTSAAVKGTSAWGGAELGAAIGTAGGPIGIAIGGAIGGTIGYFISSGAIDLVKAWF